MKVLMLSDVIISLENVRSARVIRREESNHTSQGVRYKEYSAVIGITYQTNCDSEYIYIYEKSNDEREQSIKLMLNNIKEILQKD